MHAVATITLGNFLQRDKEEIDVEVENEDTNETEIKEIDRSSAGNWFDSAIKSDAGIGEDPVPFKEAFVAFIYYPSLASKFGDV